MSTITNDALLQLLPQNGETLGDEIWIGSGAVTTQSHAQFAVKNPVHVVTANGTSGAAIVLPSILSNQNPPFVWVINNAASNAVSVFCFPGENVNGSANGSLSVTAGNAALFIAIPQQIFRKGNTSAGGTLNWSAVLITS